MSGVTSQGGGQIDVYGGCKITGNSKAGVLSVGEGSIVRLGRGASGCSVQGNAMMPTCEERGGVVSMEGSECVVGHAPCLENGLGGGGEIGQESDVGTGAETSSLGMTCGGEGAGVPRSPGGKEGSTKGADSGTNWGEREERIQETAVELKEGGGIHGVVELREVLTLRRGNEGEAVAIGGDLGVHPAKGHFDTEAVLDDHGIVSVVLLKSTASDCGWFRVWGLKAPDCGI